MTWGECKSPVYKPAVGDRMIDENGRERVYDGHGWPLYQPKGELLPRLMALAALAALAALIWAVFIFLVVYAYSRFTR